MTPLGEKYLMILLVLLVTGTIIVPVGAYLVGGYVVGPYEGDGGLAGYLGSIYLSAWHGERAALTLILAPLLIVLAWVSGLWLYRRSLDEIWPAARECTSAPDTNADPVNRTLP